MVVIKTVTVVRLIRPVALSQWDLHLGYSSAAVGKPQTSLGPLGGVGSGPRVEEMLEAMDSWSGLCLHYRCGWSTLQLPGYSMPGDSIRFCSASLMLQLNVASVIYVVCLGCVLRVQS